MIAPSIIRSSQSMHQRTHNKHSNHNLITVILVIIPPIFVLSSSIEFRGIELNWSEQERAFRTETGEARPGQDRAGQDQTGRNCVRCVSVRFSWVQVKGLELNWTGEIGQDRIGRNSVRFVSFLSCPVHFSSSSVGCLMSWKGANSDWPKKLRSAKMRHLGGSLIGQINQ